MSTSTPFYLLNPQFTSVTCKFATLIWLFLLIKRCMFNVRPISKCPLICEVLEKRNPAMVRLIFINHTFSLSEKVYMFNFRGTSAHHWGGALLGTAVVPLPLVTCLYLCVLYLKSPVLHLWWQFRILI